MGRKKGRCVYCGSVSATSDHIPPKALYAKPFPDALITVPNCTKCNGSAAKDDEYFRSVMAVRHDTYGRSDTEGAVERTMRAVVRAEAGGLRKLLFGSLVEVPLVTPAGLFLGTSGTFDVDMHRIRNVVERIARGLFFHHTRQPVPQNAGVMVYAIESVKNWSGAEYAPLLHAIRWAHESEEHTTPRNVLKYQYRETEEGRGSVWLFTFYEVVPFVATIVSPKTAA